MVVAGHWPKSTTIGGNKILWRFFVAAFHARNILSGCPGWTTLHYLAISIGHPFNGPESRCVLSHGRPFLSEDIPASLVLIRV